MVRDLQEDPYNVQQCLANLVTALSFLPLGIQFSKGFVRKDNGKRLMLQGTL